MEAALLESNSVDIETAESVDIALETLPLPEMQVADETCSKFGGAALICAGCPMLRFCELKTATVEEVAPETSLQVEVDELGVLDITDSFSVPKTESMPSVTTEASSDSSDSHQADISKLPESSPAPKPSYLERLLDDEVEVVVADSIMDVAERQAVPVPTAKDFSSEPDIPESTAPNILPTATVAQVEVIDTPLDVAQVEDTPIIGPKLLIDSVTSLGVDDIPVRPTHIRHSSDESTPSIVSTEVLVSQTIAGHHSPIDRIYKPINRLADEPLYVQEEAIFSLDAQPQEKSVDESGHVNAVPPEVINEEISDDTEGLFVDEFIPEVAILMPDQADGELAFVDGIVDDTEEVILQLTENTDDPIDVCLNQKTDDDGIISVQVDYSGEPIIDSLDTIEPELRLAAVKSVSAQQATIDTVRCLAIYALKWLRIDEPLRQVPVC